MASREKRPPGKGDESGRAEMAHRLKTRPFVFFGTIFILVIVVIAFVFVPTMVPQAGGMEGLTFGYYNRTPIRMVGGNFFHQRQQDLTRQRQHQLTGSTDNPALIQHDMGVISQIWRDAFNQTAVNMGIQDEMRRAGFVVPSGVVDREMARLFQMPDGRFDAAAYRSLDTATRMSIWRQMQEDIAVRQYFSDLQSVRISSNEIAFIGAIASPRRTFNMAVFPLASFPDSEVILHAQENPELFRVTHLSRIILGTEWEARQLLEMVQNGLTTFEEAALNNSQDFAFAQLGGDMGMRMAHEFTAEIWDLQERESVINLASGQLSDVVSVGTNWGFFRAEEAVRPADTSDPLHLGNIRTHLTSNFPGRVEDWALSEAHRFSAQVMERDFEEVVFAENIMRRTFGPLPANFGDLPLFTTVIGTGIPEIQHASRNLFFWEAAFSTPLMTPSAPVVIGGNVLVLFPVEESYADDFDVGFIERDYPFWVRGALEEASGNYFLASDRFVDQFAQAFTNHILPSFLMARGIN